MELLIDSCLLMEAERGRYALPEIDDKIEAVWICDAGVAEFLAGQPVKDEGKRKRWREFWDYLSQMPSLPLDRAACERAGELSYLARTKGFTVPLGDALHAGVADLHGLKVATLDVEDFKAMGIEPMNPRGSKHPPDQASA